MAITIFLLHDKVLWFLPCLFIVEMLFYLSFKNKNKIVSMFIVVAYAALGFICFKFCTVHLPWGIDTALTAIVFDGIANVLKKDIQRLLQLPLVYLTIGTFVLMVLFIAISTSNGRVDMLGMAYNNYAMFIAIAFVGILFCLFLSRMLESAFSKVTFAEYIAANTLIIFAFHSLAFTVIKAVAVFILKYPVSIFSSNYILSLFVAVMAIIMLVPAMYLWDKYFPLLIGKKVVRTPDKIDLII